MRTVIKGKSVVHSHVLCIKQKEVFENGENKMVYVEKPFVKIEDEFRYTDMYVFNEVIDNTTELFLDENKRVPITKRIFRADLGEYHYLTNHVVDEDDIGKQDAEFELKKHIKAFNKMMIESNKRLKAYCEIHKLNAEDTDVLELWRIVYPENDYNITDGKMIVVPAPNYEKHMSYDRASYTSIGSALDCRVSSRYDF